MTTSRVRWIALCASVALAACGGGDGDGGGIIVDPNVITEPGTYTRELGVDQLRRNYLMYVPTSADLSQPVPVVMVLHGNPPTDMRPLTDMNLAADTLGFVAVYPQSWNVGEWAFACDVCNQPAEQGVDDVKYFRAVLQQLRSDLNVDNARIYISGFSQGGLMTTRLACALGGEFAGVGIVGAIGWDWHVENCPSGPIHTMWIVGTQDHQFPWEGQVGPVVSQLSAEDFRAAWQAKNNCSADAVETPVPDLDDTDGTTGVAFEYLGCTREFIEYRFEGMDHNWPGSRFLLTGLTNRDMQASGVLARFFLENVR